MEILYFIIKIVISILIPYVLYKVYNFIRVTRMFKLIPGPKEHFLIGQVLYMSQKADKLHIQLREFAKEFPNGYKLWGAHIPSVVIFTPEDMEIILSNIKHIEKSSVYNLLQPWMEEGLITSTGLKWQKRRKILTPAFHFNILRRFMSIINEHCRELINELESSDRNKINVIPLISKHTLNVICETAMGTKMEQKNTKQAEYRNSIHELIPIILERLMKPWIYFQSVYVFTYLYWKEKKILKTLHNFTKSIIKEREDNFKMSDVENLEEELEADDVFMKRKKRLAMLDLLLSAKNNGFIDDQGIREEVDTFMFAGHDTVSMALSYALMNIANHKTVQDKIISELDEIFGNSDRVATLEDLQSMKYIEMCIKESLRIYPSVHFISRWIHEDVQLSKFKIPAETMVHIMIYDLHRNEKYFPDPEKYIPERFSPENVIGRHPYAFVPFSAGPRNCIGQRFALMEMKCIISSIMRKYTMEAITKPSDLTLLTDIVLRCKENIYIKLEPRIKT